MDLVSKLKADLAKGFSKIQLEKCIGLPQNSLSGIIAGTKEISKISALKIEQWENSEKPNPLSLAMPKKKKVALQDLNKPTNLVEEQKPAGSEKSNFSIDTLHNTPAANMSYIELLRMAKSGVTDAGSFKSMVLVKKGLSPNQRQTIISHLK